MEGAKVKKISAVIFLMLFYCVSYAQESSRTVTAIGQGKTKDIAIDQAKRAAVESSLGTVVSGQTITKNMQLANDVILSRANGFLKNYREMSIKHQGGLFIVEIEAEVTQIFDEIMKDQAAIDLLLAWMDKPRMMILVNEQNNSEETEACETELARKLSEWHLDLVSKRTLNPELLSESASSETVKRIALSAYREGAELLLIGQALAEKKEGIQYLEGTGMKSVQADFSAQIVDASAGKILASYTTHAAAVHVSEITAGMESLTKCSAMMADSLIAAMLKWSSSEQLSARQIIVEVRDAGYSDFNKLKKKLYDTGGVSTVSQRSFSAQNGVLVVDYYGKPEDFAVELDGLQIDSGNFYVEELHGEGVVLEFTANP